VVPDLRTVQDVFVRHEANVASGGHVEHIGIGDFLSSGQGPEQQELLRLIGTLADQNPEPH
jgi:hypothetical protein